MYKKILNLLAVLCITSSLLAQSGGVSLIFSGPVQMIGYHSSQSGATITTGKIDCFPVGPGTATYHQLSEPESFSFPVKTMTVHLSEYTTLAGGVASVPVSLTLHYTSFNQAITAIVGTVSQNGDATISFTHALPPGTLITFDTSGAFDTLADCPGSCGWELDIAASPY